MDIPDKAVEAAARAAFVAGYMRRVAVPDRAQAEKAWDERNDQGREPYRARARDYLEAAAPYIAAHALDGASSDFHKGETYPGVIVRGALKVHAKSLLKGFPDA